MIGSKVAASSLSMEAPSKKAIDHTAARISLASPKRWHIFVILSTDEPKQRHNIDKFGRNSSQHFRIRHLPMFSVGHNEFLSSRYRIGQLKTAVVGTESTGPRVGTPIQYRVIARRRWYHIRNPRVRIGKGAN
jgi:hypothetical protein